MIIADLLGSTFFALNLRSFVFSLSFLRMLPISFPLLLSTDSGGEYLSTEFQAFLASKGILHQRSCPSTPQQNGVAERKIVISSMWYVLSC
jgi:transposase InsO family protein